MYSGRTETFTVMLLVYKNIPHMPLSESENDSDSVWAKIFASKTSHHEASYHIRTKHMGIKLPSVHMLGDFNFKDIAWPDRLNKSGSVLGQSGTNVD